MLNLFDKGNVRTEGDDCDPVLTRRSRSAGRHVLAIPFRHAELVSASVQTCIVSLFLLRSFSFFVLQAKKENEPKERNSALLKELLKSLFENFRSQEPVNFLQILKNL